MAGNFFEPMYELDFIESQTGQKASARIGPPVFDPTNDFYYCLSEVAGFEDGGVARAYGGHAFHAMSLCFERFRIIFEKHAGDFRSSAGDSPHMYFPKTIPWVYGSDVYERLCKMVDDEIQKIEDERTRRRENRSRRGEI